MIFGGQWKHSCELWCLVLRTIKLQSLIKSFLLFKKSILVIIAYWYFFHTMTIFCLHQVWINSHLFTLLIGSLALRLIIPNECWQLVCWKRLSLSFECRWNFNPTHVLSMKKYVVLVESVVWNCAMNFFNFLVIQLKGLTLFEERSWLNCSILIYSGECIRFLMVSGVESKSAWVFSILFRYLCSIGLCILFVNWNMC